MTLSIGKVGKAALVLGIAVIMAVVLYFVGTQYATISILIVVLGLLATVLQITGFSLRDLGPKQLTPDSPGVAPPAIKEAIRVGGLTIEREFRGAEAVSQYRDGTSRLLIRQLKPEADEISDAARLVSLGQFGEAQTKASEAIKLLEGAKLEQPLRLLAESYLIQGDAAFGKELYADAERFYSSSHRLASVVDDDLLTAAAARGVGIAKGRQGRHKDALDAFDESLKLNSKDASTWYNRGLALGKLGRNEDALDAFDECLKLDPKHASAWYNRGVALGILGRHEDALHAYDECLKLDPKDASAWNNKGVALGNLGRYEDALHAYDEALKLNPKYANAWYNKGGALSYLGRNDEALASADKALQIDPTLRGKKTKKAN